MWRLPHQRLLSVVIQCWFSVYLFSILKEIGSSEPFNDIKTFRRWNPQLSFLNCWTIIPDHEPKSVRDSSCWFASHNLLAYLLLQSSVHHTGLETWRLRCFLFCCLLVFSCYISFSFCSSSAAHHILKQQQTEKTRQTSAHEKIWNLRSGNMTFILFWI